MIERPEAVIDRWLVEPITRVIVHLEAAADPAVIIKKCRDAGREVGLAVNPDTSWTIFEPWFGKADLFLPLGVPPGASGQKPDWDMILEKIAVIRQACPSCIIEADGGVDTENAHSALAAGASILVAGAAIFDAPDIAAALKELQEAIQSPHSHH